MADTLGFFMSVLVAVVFGGLVLPGAALYAFRRAWRDLTLARSLKEAELSAFTGRPGPTVAHGKVAWIDPAECPISIEIEQQGSESDTRSGRSVQWTEVDRKTTRQPFEVLLADGRKVRVEPDEDTRIADRLEQVEIVATGVRKKRAAFDPGDEVWVVGAMRPGRPGASGPASAYRGTVASAPGKERRPLVMRRTPKGPMLLSSIRLGADRTKPALYHLLAGVVFTLAAVFLNALELRDFYASWLHGETVLSRPLVPVGALYFGLTSMLFLVLYWAGGRAVRPWYERSRLDEAEKGTLPIVLRAPPAEHVPDRTRTVSEPPVDMSLRERDAEREVEASVEASLQVSDATAPGPR